MKIETLSYITFLTELLPFFFFLFNLKKIKEKDLKVFFIYLTLLFVLVLPVFYFRYISPSSIPRLIFLRIFLIVEFVSISLVFYYNINKKLIKKIILIVPWFFILFSVYDYVDSTKGQFSYIPLAVECLILVIYIIYFFFEKIQINTPTPIYTTHIFWIAVAFIFYCSGNFFLFLYSNVAIKNEQFQNQYTVIYSTFTILKNILLCLGISLNSSEQIYKQPIFFIQDNTLGFNLNSKN